MSENLFFKDTQVIFIILADSTVTTMVHFCSNLSSCNSGPCSAAFTVSYLCWCVAQELWVLDLGALVSTRGICIRMYILMWQNSSHYCAVFALHISDHLPIKWFSADKAQSL